MAVKKLSIALDPDVAEAAASAAETSWQSLSAWLNDAARTRLRIEGGLVAFAEWEAEQGPAHRRGARRGRPPARRTRWSTVAAQRVIVYDTGAPVAGERNVLQMWALHDAALRRGLTPIVPAGVLAQAWRGGPQARLSQLLRGCISAPLDGPLARDAGSHRERIRRRGCVGRPRRAIAPRGDRDLRRAGNPAPGVGGGRLTPHPQDLAGMHG